MTEHSRPVKSAELTAFAHATEDLEKVKKAVRTLLPEDTEPDTLEEEKLTGHYNDSIILLTARLAHRREASALLSHITEKLSSLDYATLTGELGERVDLQGNLYMRLDKQGAYAGVVALQERDPVRVKFKLLIPHKADPVETARQLLGTIRESGAG